MKTEHLQKENYEAPAIEIIDIEVEQNIMAGSPSESKLDKNINIGFDENPNNGFDW